MKGAVWIVILILVVSLVNAESIFLSDYMEEGQTKVYETGNGVYVVSLLSVSDSNKKAVFRLNDEMSKGIRLKDSHVFKDGSEIVLRELVINDAGNGNDEAYFYFYGTGEGVLELKNVSRYALENNLCNFDGHCSDETKDECCYDCGCDKDEICVNNKCVAEEKKGEEGAENGAAEETEEAKSEGKNGVKKEDGEKKAAYAMLIIMLLFILVIVWFVIKKKRKKF